MYKIQLQLMLVLIWAIDCAAALPNSANYAVSAANNLSKNPQIEGDRNGKPQRNPEKNPERNPERKPDLKPATSPDKNTKPGAAQKVSTTKTPPDSNTKPGGGLDPSKSCKSTNRVLTLLTPRKNPVLTTSSHPTFWFYIPYAAEDIKRGEFVLVTQDEKTLIYETSFQLPKTPGIVNISLPASAEFALAEGQFYHWYLRIYCRGNTNDRADLSADGWVKKVAATPETERLINAGSPDIWYDSLTRLGNLLLTAPQDAKLRSDWHKLLEPTFRRYSIGFNFKRIQNF
jgi:hypothetical protein